VVIAERFNFYRRNQEPGESIATYVAELRRLTTDCTFDAYLNDALRDKFVCGLRSEATQRRLLAEKDLTFTKAVEIAQGMEAAARDTQLFKSSSAAINQLKHTNKRESNSYPVTWRSPSDLVIVVGRLTTQHHSASSKKPLAINARRRNILLQSVDPQDRLIQVPKEGGLTPDKLTELNGLMLIQLQTQSKKMTLTYLYVKSASLHHIQLQ